MGKESGCDREEQFEDRLMGGTCGKEYQRMKKCLDEHDRSWSICQEYVLAVKMCHEKKNQRQSQPSESS
ncbi:MAG: hypothetical protein MHM6MM_001403 [Cercozoa sp. M6MM]